MKERIMNATEKKKRIESKQTDARARPGQTTGPRVLVRDKLEAEEDLGVLTQSTYPQLVKLKISVRWPAMADPRMLNLLKLLHLISSVLAETVNNNGDNITPDTRTT